MVTKFLCSVVVMGGCLCAGAIEIPIERQLAPFCEKGYQGSLAQKKKCIVTEYHHHDGNTYLVGVAEWDERQHEFGLMVEFIKGKHTSAFRWI